MTLLRRSVKARCLVCVVLLYAIVVSPAAAEIFKWIDDSGRVHFTDSPSREQQVEKIKVKINSYTSPEIVPFEAAFTPSTRRDKVVLYSTTWCGYCKKARRYFATKGIPFVEYDTETSKKGREDYKALKGTGVPIILVGQKRMNGFSPSKFEGLYR